jgi:hypothetical protein
MAVQATRQTVILCCPKGHRCRAQSRLRRSALARMDLSINLDPPRMFGNRPISVHVRGELRT